MAHRFRGGAIRARRQKHFYHARAPSLSRPLHPPYHLLLEVCQCSQGRATVSYQAVRKLSTVSQLLGQKAHNLITEAVGS